jgi:hypothetical protein
VHQLHDFGVIAELLVFDLVNGIQIDAFLRGDKRGNNEKQGDSVVFRIEGVLSTVSNQWR